MYCKKCGTKLAEDSRFCHKCGDMITNEEQKRMQVVKCPHCDAQLSNDKNEPMIHCHMCGAEIIVDNKSLELDRMLNVKSAAKKRDMQTDIEYEKHQQKMSIITFVFENPIFCIVTVLFAFYVLIRIFKGDFAGIDIVLIALILNWVWKITHKKK